MKYAIGIDLGTCNSATTRLHESGHSVMIQNADGKALTPSVVNFSDGGEVYFGEEARRVEFHETENTVSRFKRHMGTDKTWKIRESEYNPVELSGLLLERLRKDATDELRRLDESACIEKVVITVPAKFSSLARKATKDAAEAAGLDVYELLEEPNAALLYYEHTLQGRSDVNGLYCVVDLGGGTLDISIVRVDGDNFSVICSEGCVKLGGIDFDRALQVAVQDKFRVESNGGILGNDDFDLQEAEDLKKSLSEKVSRRIRPAGLDPKSGRQIKKSFEFTRDEFEVCIASHLEQLREVCLSVLVRHSISPEQLREVLIVGGSVRIPAVKRTIDSEFGRASELMPNCDEAVARGAAIYAAVRGSSTNEIPYNSHQRKVIRNITLQETLHRYYGVVTLDEDGSKAISFLLERGAKVPCTKQSEYSLRAGDFGRRKKQRTVEWRIVESTDGNEDLDSSTWNLIGTETLVVPNEFPDGSTERKLMATFSFDNSKSLSCEFVDVLTGRVSRTTHKLLRDGEGRL